MCEHVLLLVSDFQITFQDRFGLFSRLLCASSVADRRKKQKTKGQAIVYVLYVNAFQLRSVCHIIGVIMFLRLMWSASVSGSGNNSCPLNLSTWKSAFRENSSSYLIDSRRFRPITLHTRTNTEKIRRKDSGLVHCAQLTLLFGALNDIKK